jgi:hypothetical protein
MGEAFLTRSDLPRAPEQVLARDMAKKAVPFAPVPIILSAFFWGFDGAVSSAVGVIVVVVNFLLAAALMAWSARISIGLLMGAALGGYILRLGLILVTVLLIKDFAWVEIIPLGLTLVVTHLGLLVWEMRYVSASLAFPDLRPTSASATHAPSPVAASKENKE